tara:strand:- start:23106 stop:23837 length:732 start_codon:yes stop_codon:yes gene_type:complete
MRYCFDIDGTICSTPTDRNGKPDYQNSIPKIFVRDYINELYKKGDYIIFQTARGKSSGKDWSDFTRNQLNKWGFKYHELFDMFCKPTADIFIDDKGINADVWIRKIPLKKGILAGAFDLIHPGYIKMFKEAKLSCNYLAVALHEDPSIERPEKLSPVQTTDERKEILESIKYIDEVKTYKYEKEFIKFLDDFDIRFLGTDYSSGNYTAKNHKVEIKWISRNHNYSTTKLKMSIFESLIDKKSI